MHKRIESLANLDVQLECYLDFLLTANRHQNLTRRTTRADWWNVHFPVALALTQWLSPAGLVYDIGSGNGYPALPLALARPDLCWLLIEAEQAKVRFLREAVHAMGLLERVRIWHGRAETAGQSITLRATADAVTACAVGNLTVVLELGLPLLHPNGMLLALKGRRAAAELASAQNALTRLNATWLESTPLAPQSAECDMVCMRFEKTGPTPPAYPRAPGRPKKCPLD